MKKTIFIIGCAALLAACGETSQDKPGVGSDKPVQNGTGVAVYTDPGWKAGDKAGWANHLKARVSYGQDDHARAPK
jgi:hypothetical protein